MAGANVFAIIVMGIILAISLIATPVIILVASRISRNRYPRWTSIAIVVAMSLVIISNSANSILWMVVATLIGWLPFDLARLLSRPSTAHLGWFVFAIAFLCRCLSAKKKSIEETEPDN